MGHLFYSIMHMNRAKNQIRQVTFFFCSTTEIEFSVVPSFRCSLVVHLCTLSTWPGVWVRAGTNKIPVELLYQLYFSRAAAVALAWAAYE